MLTRVASGQARFVVPGLTTDARGIAAGKQLALRFPTWDRAVSFLRVLSGAACPDEIWHGLRLHHLRPTDGMRELLIVVPHTSSHVADGVARAARLAGGACFTGTGRHFVPYRDKDAPLGYDAATLVHTGDGDLILYTANQSVACQLQGDIPFDSLLLRLDLRREPRGAQAMAREDEAGVLYLSCRRGLGPVLAAHFYRSGVQADTAECEPDSASPFGDETPFWLFRLRHVPARLLGLVVGTPGLQLYRAVLDNVAVAVGFAHVLHLEGCRAAVAPDRFLLLRPRPGRPVVMTSPPDFVPLGDRVAIPGQGGNEIATMTPARRSATGLGVPLRLERSPASRPRPVASWIPWSQADWLRRLCYALPTSALAGYRLALLEAGILVLAPERLEGFPFGRPLEEAAPGVLIPVGTCVRPAVSPSLIRDSLAAGGDGTFVFSAADAPPFRIADESFAPFERRVLSRIAVSTPPMVGALPSATPPPGAAAPEVENDALGPLPVWGLRR